MNYRDEVQVSPVEREESWRHLNKTVRPKTLLVDDKGARFLEPALRSRHMLKM